MTPLRRPAASGVAVPPLRVHRRGAGLVLTRQPLILADGSDRGRATIRGAMDGCDTRYRACDTASTCTTAAPVRIVVLRAGSDLPAGRQHRLRPEGLRPEPEGRWPQGRWPEGRWPEGRWPSGRWPEGRQA